ncbi:hypothetical protein BD289DRAFT_442306 [Coniella lustricola]|uniref:Uncharacterized protein n=1 Tax=Coniella lustricola TaxID=2025994 RepID=A0A2T2ZYD1_9PEZI|nr:hypothetical protein BD289DRAFT_442306 [Coniella lustricola]
MSYVTTVPWYRLAALPVLSPLWGYNPADHQTDCLESLMFYTVAAGRRLTDAERDSILEHITRTGVAASYDRPLAIGVAAWLMTRSWAKSRPIKHGGPLYNAASASTYSPYAQQYHHHAHVQPISTGTLGADGHITHFSGPHPPPPPPQQQPQQPYFASARGSGSQVLGAFVRRVARTGAVGLSCFAGYLALRIPYRHLLGMREVEAVSHDFRLEAVCHDMDNTMKNRSNRRDVD